METTQTSARAPSTLTTPRAQSLRQRLGSTAAGELGGAACLWLAQVLVARAGGVSMLGAFGLGFAIATPVILFTNLHLRPVYVVDETGDWDFNDYLGVRLVSLSLATLGGGAAVALMGFERGVASVVLAVLLYRVAESLGDILIAPAQRQNALLRYGVSRGLRGVLLLGGIFAGQAMGLGVSASIWLGALLTLGLSVVYDRETARRFATSRPRMVWSRMVRLGRWTAPAGIAAGILSLTLGVPAYVLEAMREVREVGFLTAALSIVAIGSMLNVVVGGATIRTLASLYARGDGEHLPFLARLSGGIALLHGCLIGATIFAGDLYLSTVYGPDYVHLHGPLVWVAVAGLVAGVGNMMSQTVMAMRRFRTQLLINTVGIALAVAGAFVFISSHGVLGAIYVHLGIAVYRLIAFFVVLVSPLGRGGTGSHHPSASKIQK